MSFPKGDNAKAANLKCCKPKGIPMIVIHNIAPKTKWDRQIQMPPITVISVKTGIGFAVPNGKSLVYTSRYIRIIIRFRSFAKIQAEVVIVFKIDFTKC